MFTSCLFVFLQLNVSPIGQEKWIQAFPNICWKKYEEWQLFTSLSRKTTWTKAQMRKETFQAAYLTDPCGRVIYNQANNNSKYYYGADGMQDTAVNIWVQQYMQSSQAHGLVLLWFLRYGRGHWSSERHLSNLPTITWPVGTGVRIWIQVVWREVRLRRSDGIDQERLACPAKGSGFCLETMGNLWRGFLQGIYLMGFGYQKEHAGVEYRVDLREDGKEGQ